MCGIVVYIGNEQATDFLLEGLRRLEYRGYDSAGLATLTGSGQIGVVKAVGRIANLVGQLKKSPLSGTIGIGHTRWATHGAATDVNAHPHIGGNGEVAVVHNGVIENYQLLKERLQSEGYVFHSATDTEVVAHLIASSWEKVRHAADDGQVTTDPHEQLVLALQTAVSQLKGTYGLAVAFEGHADVILAARLGSPLVVGVAEGSHFVASDASPLVGYADQIVYLADHQIALELYYWESMPVSEIGAVLEVKDSTVTSRLALNEYTTSRTMGR